MSNEREVRSKTKGVPKLPGPQMSTGKCPILDSRIRLDVNKVNTFVSAPGDLQWSVAARFEPGLAVRHVP